MTDSERFTHLVGACLQGLLSNPELHFSANHTPVDQAIKYAQEAMSQINEIYPQRRFAEQIENGNGRQR